MTSKTKLLAFSSEQDEMLVELVSQNPTLYDIRLESYKDSFKKENIWRYIGSELNNKTSDECKKRWKYIKDSYNRYKRKKKVGAGTAALPKTSKWEFYERLQFLELSSTSEEGISNLQENETEFMNTLDNEENNADHNESTHDESIQSISTFGNEPVDERTASTENSELFLTNCTQDIINAEKARKENTIVRAKTAPRKKKQNKQDKFYQYMKKRDAQRQALLKHAYKEKYVDEDDVNSFSDHIKLVLKKLPPILKARAKAEIFTVISKYEIMSVEKPLSTSSTSSMSNFSLYGGHSPVTSPTPQEIYNNKECGAPSPVSSPTPHDIHCNKISF